MNVSRLPASTEDMLASPQGLGQKVLDLALRAGGVGIWTWDVRDNGLSYSRIAREICGFPLQGEVTRDMVRAIVHPDDRSMTERMAEQALDQRDGTSEPYDYRIIRADDGSIRSVRAYGVVEFKTVNGESRARRLSGSLQDITDLKQAMAALENSETRLRLATEIGSIAVWEVDLLSHTIVHSPELNRLCGFPPEAHPTADEFRALYAPGEMERLRAYSEGEMAEGKTRLQSVIKHEWPDGQVKWLMMRAQLGPETAPPFSRAVGTLIDVTDTSGKSERLATVARELRHRLKNAVTVIGAIASRSWPKGEDHKDGLHSFKGRLHAIGSVADLMFDNETETGPLDTLIRTVTDPYRADCHDPFILDGGSDMLDRRMSTSVAMAIHELCTNAVKHGALSTPDGTVGITWGDAADGSLVIDWTERGGPPVTPPRQTGFGLQLLTAGLFARPSTTDLTFDPDGLTCRIRIVADGPARPTS